MSMGVVGELGFEAKPANVLQRLIQTLASSRCGAWFFAKTLYPQDKVIFKLTGGRLTVPTVLAGLPVLMFTTTGARTGRRRTMPLLGIPVGENLAVIGSNYGQKKTPGWVYNLEADPSATVEYGGRSVDVVARRANEPETEEVFRRAGSIYSGFAKYRARASHRVIRVFVLEKASTGELVE
jgi:deazaflavin-dependent oxidoreductase (nitroreductase family)